MCEHFENKTFMKHGSQGFEQFLMINAHTKEEASFMKARKGYDTEWC